MPTLNIDEFIGATDFLFLSTGDKITKKFVIECMVYNGIRPVIAGRVWSMLVESGRVKKGLVSDITENHQVDPVEVIRGILVQLAPDGGLTEPLVHALYVVTGLSTGRVQSALNALENQNFLEQRRTVAPWQYIPRRWGT